MIKAFSSHQSFCAAKTSNLSWLKRYWNSWCRYFCFHWNIIVPARCDKKHVSNNGDCHSICQRHMAWIKIHENISKLENHPSRLVFLPCIYWHTTIHRHNITVYWRRTLVAHHLHLLAHLSPCQLSHLCSMCDLHGNLWMYPIDQIQSQTP